MSEPTAIFQPLPWQIEPWRDKSSVLLLTGSAGGGKSRLAAEKVNGYCKKYPGSTWLIMRKAREWNTKSILPFFNETVIGGDSSVRFLKSEGVFEYANGSRIYSGGMMGEEQREAVRSIGGAGGLDGAWLEEATAFSRQDFEEVLGRLRHNAADWRQVILTTNPGPTLHWIHTDLIKGKQASVYYSGAKDNPNNAPDYIQTLEKMTGVMYKRLVLGQWVQAEGVVYDNFDYAIHVTKRLPEEMKTWYLAMDEGYTHPAVILQVGEDADGRWHVFREWYERGKLQSEVVSQAREWYLNCWTPPADAGVTPLPIQASGVAVDESAAGLIADLRNAGIPARGAKGRVLDGIQAIQDRLKVQGDGRPRLTIDPSCVNTINEFESYVWKQSAAGFSKDEPVKENDHCFVGDTKVLTRSGLVNIKDICPGDFVWSPLGWNLVYRAGCTGKKPVRDYGIFRCTPNHKILTSRGLIEVDALRYSDIIAVWEKQRSYTSTEFLTGVIQNRPTKIFPFIFGAVLIKARAARRDFYTAMYGNTITAKFLTVLSSIMLTVILGIIALIIWSLSALLNMPKNIIGDIGKGQKNILRKSGCSQKPGTPAQRGMSGTRNMELMGGKTGNCLRRNVRFAGKNIKPRFLVEANTVIRIANKQPCVDEEVYNLATKNGMYFANGVLVSNCMDALRYLADMVGTEHWLMI